MDLTSGTPLWPTLDGLPAAYPRLHQDLRCDVAVIGGGITGALVAHRFAARGNLDRAARGRRDRPRQHRGHHGTHPVRDRHPPRRPDRPGRRASTRCGATGCASTRCAASASWRGRRRAAAPGVRPGASTSASRRADARRARARVHRARREAGIEVDLLDERDIRSASPSPGRRRSLSPVAGELDAFRLTHKLLADGAEGRPRGLRPHPGDRVLRPSRRGVDLRTDGGARVRARRVVFATGYETPEFLDRKIVRLHSTFALATAPMPSFDGWGEDRCLIWETARPYFYARTTGDGRAVMGGADRPFATAHKRRRLLTRQTRRIEDRFAKLFPAIRVGTWTGAGAAPSARPGTASRTSARCPVPERLLRPGVRRKRHHLQLDRRQPPARSLPRPAEPGRRAVPVRSLIRVADAKRTRLGGVPPWGQLATTISRPRASRIVWIRLPAALRGPDSSSCRPGFAMPPLSARRVRRGLLPRRLAGRARLLSHDPFSSAAFRRTRGSAAALRTAFSTTLLAASAATAFVNRFVVPAIV